MGESYLLAANDGMLTTNTYRKLSRPRRSVKLRLLLLAVLDPKQTGNHSSRYCRPTKKQSNQPLKRQV
jgi:hypothetical protein